MSWYQSKNLAIAELVGLLDRQTQGEDVNSEWRSSMSVVILRSVDCIRWIRIVLTEYVCIEVGFVKTVEGRQRTKSFVQMTTWVSCILYFQSTRVSLYDDRS